MFWLGFGIGIMLGGNIGVFIMALFQLRKN